MYVTHKYIHSVYSRGVKYSLYTVVQKKKEMQFNLIKQKT